MVQKLAEFCIDVSKLLNQPHLRFDDNSKYEEFNRKSIEFMFDMYYQNKRSNAQKMGDK